MGLEAQWSSFVEHSTRERPVFLMRGGLDTKMYNSVVTESFFPLLKGMVPTSLDQVFIAPAYLQMEGPLLDYF